MGEHEIKIIATDVDPNIHVTETSITFFVSHTAPPPRWDNALPGNFTDVSPILSGDLEFFIDVISDYRLSFSVNIQISTITGVNASDVNSPGDVDISDIRLVEGPHNMISGETNFDDWITYNSTWDSTKVISGLYLVEFTIEDAHFNLVVIKMLIIVENDPDPLGYLFSSIPGYNGNVLIGLVAISTLGLIWHLKTKKV
ncbi:MAG: hypothetical protein ACTSRK_18160 [Promethearchaeota archaeon]